MRRLYCFMLLQSFLCCYKCRSYQYEKTVLFYVVTSVENCFFFMLLQV